MNRPFGNEMDVNPAVRTIYSHKKHGRQVPQLLPTKKIMVEPKNKSERERERYVPQPTPDLLQTGNGIQVYAKDPRMKNKTKFVPKIPQLSPNSFTQAWRKEELEREAKNTLEAGEWIRGLENRDKLFEPVIEPEKRKF